jgi:hypothetical protein
MFTKTLQITFHGNTQLYVLASSALDLDLLVQRWEYFCKMNPHFDTLDEYLEWFSCFSVSLFPASLNFIQIGCE